MWVSRWLTSEKSGLLVQILQVKGIVDCPFMMFMFGVTAAAEYVEKSTLVMGVPAGGRGVPLVLAQGGAVDRR